MSQADQQLLQLLQQANRQFGESHLPGETLAGRQARRRQPVKLAFGWLLAAVAGLGALSLMSGLSRPLPTVGTSPVAHGRDQLVSHAATYLGHKTGDHVVLWKVLTDDQHLVTLVLKQGLKPPFIPRTGERFRFLGQPLGEGAVSVTRSEDLSRLPTLTRGNRKVGRFMVIDGLGEGLTLEGERIHFIATGWPTGAYRHVELGLDERLVPLALELGR